MFELSLYFFDCCSILINMYSYGKRNEGKVMEHYLDNSATTKVSQKAAEKAFEIMTEITAILRHSICVECMQSRSL